MFHPAPDAFFHFQQGRLHRRGAYLQLRKSRNIQGASIFTRTAQHGVCYAIDGHLDRYIIKILHSCFSAREDRLQNNDIHGAPLFLDELLEEIAAADASLALTAWEWCAEKFFPYRQYGVFDALLATSLLSQAEELPPEFLDGLVTDIQKNFSWAEILVTGCGEEAYGYAVLITKLLQRGDGARARRMMELYTGQETTKPKEIDRLFSGIIDACEMETDLEAMDLVKAELLPVIQGMPGRPATHRGNCDRKAENKNGAATHLAGPAPFAHTTGSSIT